MPCLGWFFVSSFCEKGMFFVIFHPKLAKNGKNLTRIRKSRGVFCCGATVQFGVIHTHLVRVNSQFSYKIALFWLIFSLFFFLRNK